ncbi:S53 family peptidase [Actinacidiphila acididurans]|uniref:S8/S53 family peptidase n=1 Tax=Actinacidiphila acididurans TaxID=2784346 RepID=A0ABS2TUR5_9ACTN|nr:S53 family peptidase [Actinacidiphila acididurans]MBM9506572.1 S8/S53 family peptidase [Actinacidiphila acididurans]
MGPRAPTDRHVGVAITHILKPRTLRGRAVVVAAASLGLAAGSLALAAPSQASGAAAPARAIAGTHPAWATASADAGRIPATTKITGTVYLAGQDPAGLTAYATAVSDPNSPDYGKFLTPAAYQARFGATPAQIAAVQKWAKDAGLTVVKATEHAVTVQGTDTAITKAFGTGIEQYRVSGQLRHAPARDVAVPASVSSAVIGVAGLASPGTNTARPDYVRTDTKADNVATAQAAPAARPADGLPTTATCSDYWGQKPATGAPAGYTAGPVAFDQCSYHPSQLRKAYGITASGLTGKGATVAIVDAYGSSTMEADANQYATGHGDKAFRPGQYSEHVDPAQWNSQSLCGGPAGWAPEEALDVEMAHGLAPDANVVYVGANSCLDDDLLAAISTIVDNHLADVVSNSWGELMHTTDGADVTATEIAAYEQVFKQAAVEGIGIGFSAGDCGDSSPAAAATGANCQADSSRAQANWPDSDPWVTSVGGTALARSDASGTYGFESDMGTLRSSLSADGKSWTPFPPPFYFGGGGGTSEDFAQPWYQTGTVPGSLARTLMTGARTKQAMRVTPDVSMNGDLYTSVAVGLSDGAPYSEGGYGGTSVSSPEFAAVQADAIQARGHAIGFANPSVYDRAHLFRDVVDQAAQRHRAPLVNIHDAGVVNGALVARLIVFGQDTSLNAVPGYDEATGVGSPTQSYLKSFR